MQGKFAAPRSADKAARVKKQYSKPELRHFGNIRDITQAIANTANNDGGGSPPNKTH
jgi:hypothetical protein